MLNPSEKAAASRILNVLGRNTLAVKLTGAYAADSQRSLESIAAELESEAKVDQIVLPDHVKRQAIQLAFRQSAKQMPDDAITLFTLLAVFRATDVGRNALLDVAKAVGIDNAADRINLLVSRALVDVGLNDRVPIPADRDRLMIHPLLHAFAKDLLDHLTEHQRAKAYHACAQYYADYVHFVSDRWLAPDEQNIISALEWAHEVGEDEHVAALCDGMRAYWHRRGRARTTKRYLLWGSEAADRIAKASNNYEQLHRAARLTLSYGEALKVTGQLDDAERIFIRSRAIYRAMNEHRGEGLVLTSMGQVAQARGKLDDAKEYFNEALKISVAENDEQHRAANLMYLGQVAQARGKITEAEGLFQKALSLFREINDPQGMGADLASLAQLQQVRGHWREAEALFLQSLSIRRENDDLPGEASVLSLLGQLCLARGDLVATEDYLRQSLDLRHEVEDRYGEAVDLCQFGRLFLDKGDYEQSQRYFYDSLDIFRDLHVRTDEGVVLSQLALVAIELHRSEEATHLLQQSLSIRQEVQDQRGEGVDRALLGRIALERNELDKAETLYSRSLEIAREIGNRRGEGVNLRQLGVIAEQRHHSKFAEDYLRESLHIANEVENGLDIADASLVLGCLLCEQYENSEEGCDLLQEAVELYTTMQVPGAQTASDAVKRFGCVR